MKKLMNNNVMKVMLCAGLVWGANFGGKKKQTKSRVTSVSYGEEKAQESFQRAQEQCRKKLDYDCFQNTNKVMLAGCVCYVIAVGALALCYPEFSIISRENS